MTALLRQALEAGALPIDDLQEVGQVTAIGASAALLRLTIAP